MSFSSRRRNYLCHSHRSDGFISFIKEMLGHSFVLDAVQATAESTWSHVEDLIEEHRALSSAESGIKSRLQEAVPSIGSFHTPLALVTAWKLYDAKYKVSSRRFVQPSFNEVRHVLNLGQVIAMRDSLKLVSFDGDCTLYSDGKDFSDAKLARFITLLLEQGVYVALGAPATHHDMHLPCRSTCFYVGSTCAPRCPHAALPTRRAVHTPYPCAPRAHVLRLTPRRFAPPCSDGRWVRLRRG